MLNLLRSNQPIAALVAPVLALFGLVYYVLTDAGVIELNPVPAWLPASFQWQGFSWINFLVIGLTAVVLNRTFLRHEINRSGNIFAAFFYVFPLLVMPATLPYSSVLAGSVFFVLGMNETLRIYRQNDGAASYFNAGFLFGVASLFSLYFASAELMLIVSVLYTRAAKWREILLPIVGFLLPQAIFGACLWLLDLPLNEIWFGIATEQAPMIPVLMKIFGLVIALLSAAGILLMLNTFSSSSNKSKNSKSVLLFFSLGLAASALIAYSRSETTAVHLLVLPAAWSIPWLFLERKYRLQPALLWLLLLLGIFSWVDFTFGILR